MTDMEWFWAGFWATCGVGWALTIGVIVLTILVFLAGAVIAVVGEVRWRMTR